MVALLPSLPLESLALPCRLRESPAELRLAREELNLSREGLQLVPFAACEEKVWAGCDRPLDVAGNTPYRQLSSWRLAALVKGGVQAYRFGGGRKGHLIQSMEQECEEDCKRRAG